MSIDYYIQFIAANGTVESLDGGSLYAATGLSFGSTQTVTIGSQASGAGAGKLTLDPLSFTLGADRLTTALDQALETGKSFAQIKVYTVNSQDPSTPIETTTFQLAGIKSDTVDPLTGAHAFTAAYGGVVESTPQQTGGWNTVTNTADTNPAATIGSGSGSVTVPAFNKADVVTTGAAANDQVYVEFRDATGKLLGGTDGGWIKVDAASFENEQTLNIGSQTGGVGAGKATFDPLTLQFKAGTLAPVLLEAEAAGKTLQVEVAAYGGGSPGPLRDDYSFGAAAITSIDTTDDGSGLSSLSIAYGQEQVATTTQQTNGTTSTSTESWSRITNTALAPPLKADAPSTQAGVQTQLADNGTGEGASAPTIAGLDATQTTTSEAPVTPFGTATVADVNNGGTDPVTLTITQTGAGTLSGSGLTAGSGGTSVLTGSAASVTAALQALVFTPVVGVANTSVATRFTLLAADGTAGTASDGNAAVTVTDVDPAVAPTIAGVEAAQATTADASVEPFSAATVADANDGGTDTDTLTITQTGAGTLSGTGLVAGAVGSFTLSGTAALVTSELDALVFTPEAGAPGSSTVTSFALSDESSASSTAATASTAVTDSDAQHIGTGPDQLGLYISEDAYQSNAEYTVSVDGEQIGGTQTAFSAHGAASDTLLVNGTWGPGDHTFTVDFLNDLYGGTASTDRNLYVDGATYNGTTVPGAEASLYQNGSVSLLFNHTPSTSPTTVGTGPDQLALKLSEDAYQGDAEFTVSVDGRQIGGTLAASAAHGVASDTVLVNGTWGSGDHTITIDFLNDLYAGSQSTDRNLFLDGATYNGVAVSGAQASLDQTGPLSLLFNHTPSPTTTIGAGPDQLALDLSEDAYQGDAEYTVSVDGHQIGGTQEASAAHGSASNTLLVNGNWSAGAHTCTIDFLNDLNGGSASTDRNLYLNGATYDGTTVAGAQASLYQNGSQSFVFHQSAA